MKKSLNPELHKVTLGFARRLPERAMPGALRLPGLQNRSPDGPIPKLLTTQINLNGDEYLWDDFAFATRAELIADPVKITDASVAQARDLNGEHKEVNFSFTLVDTAKSG